MGIKYLTLFTSILCSFYIQTELSASSPLKLLLGWLHNCGCISSVTVSEWALCLNSLEEFHGLTFD